MVRAGWRGLGLGEIIGERDPKEGGGWAINCPGSNCPRWWPWTQGCVLGWCLAHGDGDSVTAMLQQECGGLCSWVLVEKTDDSDDDCCGDMVRWSWR